MRNKYISLEKIIELAKNKFKGEFVVTQFLEQLRYFDDLKIDFEIIAVASLKGVDVVVSADKRTMLSRLAAETYSIINKINGLNFQKKEEKKGQAQGWWRENEIYKFKIK